MRNVTAISGRPFARRFLSLSGIIGLTLCWRRGPRGDDADPLVFSFDMNHHEQSTACVVADQFVAKLFIATRVGDTQERIEERLGSTFERYAVVQTRVLASFATVPNEGDAVEFV